MEEGAVELRTRIENTELFKNTGRSKRPNIGIRGSPTCVAHTGSLVHFTDQPEFLHFSSVHRQED